MAETKERWIMIRISRSELFEVKAKAEKYELTLSEYVRRKALDKSLKGDGF